MSIFLVGKGLLCLYNKQNNTCLLVDMAFIYSCSTDDISLVCCAQSRACELTKKRNTISGRAHVLFSIQSADDCNKN